jgi:hypothetical protein
MLSRNCWERGSPEPLMELGKAMKERLWRAARPAKHVDNIQARVALG